MSKELKRRGFASSAPRLLLTHAGRRTRQRPQSQMFRYAEIRNWANRATFEFILNHWSSKVLGSFDTAP